MDFADYRPKTAIGRVTYKRLFARREVVAQLAKLRDTARVGIEQGWTEHGVEHVARLSTHPSLFRRFVAYWRAERDAGRLAPAGPRT